MLPRKLFSAFAIAWALALYGLLALPPPYVRTRVSPWSIWGTTTQAWRSLTRWAREGHILFGTPWPGDDASTRHRAHRTAMALSARAGPQPAGIARDHLAAIGGMRAP